MINLFFSFSKRSLVTPDKVPHPGLALIAGTKPGKLCKGATESRCTEAFKPQSLRLRPLHKPWSSRIQMNRYVTVAASCLFARVDGNW